MAQLCVRCREKKGGKTRIEFINGRDGESVLLSESVSHSVMATLGTHKL